MIEASFAKINSQTGIWMYLENFTHDFENVDQVAIISCHKYSQQHRFSLVLQHKAKTIR